MKRLLIAIVLFISAIGMSIFGFFTLESKTEQLGQAFSAGIEAARTQDAQAVAESTAHIQSLWGQNRTAFSVMIQHSHLDDFEQKLGELPRLTEKQDFDGYIDACTNSQQELRHILDSEKITFGNIF